MAKAAEQLTLNVYIRGDDLRAFRAFMEEQGFTSPTLAARALVMGSISAYPSWGVTKALIETLTREIRHRLVSEMMFATMNVHRTLEQELESLGHMPPTGEPL